MRAPPNLSSDREQLTASELLECAKVVRENRDKRDRIGLRCHENTLALSTELSRQNIEHDIVAGVIVGDVEAYNTEKIYPTDEIRKEHGVRRVPGVVDENGWVKRSISADKADSIGTTHFWVEVDLSRQGETQTHIVELHAEMRGDHEYKPVATPIQPIDYVYVDDHSFSRTDLKNLIANKQSPRNIF